MAGWMSTPASRSAQRSGTAPDPWADAHADEILVTVGAQHALYLLAALLVDRTTTVGVENPGYPDARNIFALHAGRIAGLAVDEHEGVAVHDLV